MEALEERLVLHTKVQERDAELRSKEDEVLGIQEQVETMAKELKSLRAQLADAQAAHHGEVHVDVSHEVKKQRRPLVEIPENSLANRDETEISSSETDQDSADESYNSASSVAAEEEESEDSDAKSAASSSSEDRPLQRKHLSRRHSPKQLRQSPRRTTYVISKNGARVLILNNMQIRFSSSPKAAIKSRLSRLAKKREIQGEAKFRRYWEIDDDDLSDERTGMAT